MLEGELFYAFGSSRISLRRVESARVVMPEKAENPMVVGARLARSSRLSLDAGSRGGNLIVRGDAGKLADVKGYRDVRCTRSVFMDPDGLELALTDRLLVSFDESVKPRNRQRLIDKAGCVLLEEGDGFTVLQVRDDDDDAPLAVANHLAEKDEVNYAEPDALQAAMLHAALPEDPRFKNQWHLVNDGRNGGVKRADVRALRAWEISWGSPNVRIVVHDSGVDIDHPDLQANMDPGWDFDNDDIDASNDAGPHGTACAGVIAAASNQVGVVGIAPECRIVPLRVAGSHTWSEWANTFTWAASRGDIISCSWTISKNQTLAHRIREVVKNGRDGKGTPCFFATGNAGPVPAGFPANMPETIGVGASSNRDKRASYSQVGKGLDFLAPSSGGANGTLRIETTDVAGASGYSADDYCRADNSTGFGGTSSATPLAAGVAALMLSVNPNLSAKAVRAILGATARKIDKANAKYSNRTGWSRTHGFGCINAEAAVKEAQRRAAGS